jgi:phosphopantothenoylcysteine decarboxylase
MKRKILLGLTGSVASILHKKLIEEFSKIGEISVLLTDKAKHFISDIPEGIKVYCDQNEWKEGVWIKNEEILHIKLRDEYSVLVIAPCSANTLAKISNGLCDNLLTSVARAWDFNKPFIIAPAMNTEMWNHPLTNTQIKTFSSFSTNNLIVPPQKKMLACKTEGMGAMAEICNIASVMKKPLQWFFPIKNCKGIPVGEHPGAFAAQRKHEKHTGLDLYTKDGEPVYAVEDGNIVCTEPFTGPLAGCGWWYDTDCLLVAGSTGVVCYGEITVNSDLKVGDKIKRGQVIGKVKRVLLEGKERPDIIGHSTSMLHMELYPHGTKNPPKGFSDSLHDVSPFLFESEGCPQERFYRQ